MLARRRWVRVLGALYPAFMLFDIVATGNHFLFDAATGGALVVVVGWLVRQVDRARGAAPVGAGAGAAGRERWDYAADRRVAA